MTLTVPFASDIKDHAAVRKKRALVGDKPITTLHCNLSVGGMARRFSWSAATRRAAEQEEDDVEVVEFFSAAISTSDTTERESAPEAMQPQLQPQPPKRKQRVDEAAVVEQPQSVPRAGGQAAQSSVAPRDVNLLTPPTKKRRLLSQSITALDALIEVIADDDEVLSTRLEYCSNLWRFVREMAPPDVVAFVRQRGSSVVRVIETLLHTGYFPLQQLCFMTVAAILYQLHKRDTDALVAFVVACRQSLSENDVDLLELLPLREAVPWHDPRVARQRIVQINRRTGLCRSFRASRCWVSPTGKQELAHIRVNKWIDIGATTTTFYWRDESDVVVVNVPHSCVEDVEIERENCLLYIWTKHIDRLKGVRLLAFASTQQDFPGLVKALVGVEIEGYEEPPRSTSPLAVEFGSPVQTLKTSSTLELAGASPPQSPVSTVNDSSAFEAEVEVETETETVNLEAFEPEVNDDDAFEPEVVNDHHAYKPDVVGDDDGFEPAVDHSDDSDNDAGEPASAGNIDSVDAIEGELAEKLAKVSRHSGDSLKSLHERLDASREAVTDTYRRVSSAHLEAHDVIADKEYKLRATVDILQKKRLLDLPNAEFVVEDTISRAVNEADERMEEALDYAAETVVPNEPDFVFMTTSIIMLLVVVIPWVLFAVLYSGTDLNAVRQLAKDAMLLLTALLRRFSG